MTNSKDVHVVGGGLVGTLAAIYLAEQGVEVTLYERRPDMRRQDVDAGRSINLVVTDRGLKALNRVGLKEKILELSIPMKGRMLHDEEGKETFVPYGQKDDEVIHAVHRGLLNKRLLEATEKYSNLKVFFQYKCLGYDLETKTLHFLDEASGREKKVVAPVTFGTDGAWSPIRKSMLNNMMNFNYSQDFLEHGYKELSIPPSKDGDFLIDKNALHIWPRKNYMLIALPNLNGSFTCTLFMSYKGEESFETLTGPADVTEFFDRVFPDVVPLMPTLTNDFFDNPVGALATIRCNPWHAKGDVMLIGDASHAIVPFFGQGMNCGFEDVSALAELVDNNGLTDWESLFAQLNENRKPNTDAIADMALENFIEMRDTTADPKFQLKKKIGFELEKRFEGRFVPRYSMVMFHPELSYRDAQVMSQKQEKVLDALSENVSNVDEVDWSKAEDLINELYTQSQKKSA